MTRTRLGSGHTTASSGSLSEPRSAPPGTPAAEPEGEPTSTPMDLIEGGAAARASSVVRGDASASTAVGGSSTAATEPEPTLSSMEDVQKIVDDLIATSYPELASKRIKLEREHMGVDTFRSTAKPGTMLGFGKRTYVVKVNPKNFELGMPMSAAKAVVAHELSHTVDYTKRNTFSMIGLGLSYAGEPPIAYERRTDLDAIARGHGPGLITFRRWQAETLPAEALAEKQKVYFSAEEIEALEAGLAQRPELLERWRERPPRNLAEIRRDISGD